MVVRTPLDDVEFLASSDNRVNVLETLTIEPCTRGELHELSGISQPTLGRILDGFEARGWIEKSGKRYRITRLGSLMADEFGSLLDTVETIQKLSELGGRLPTDSMDFDFRLFREATVTVPHSPDVFEHIRRAEELVQDATHISWLTGNMYLDAIPQQRELVVGRGQTQEVIISADALSVAVSRPETVEVIRELLGTGDFTIRQYSGEVPVSLGMVDERAIIVPYDDHNVPCALIDTENETIREWVSATMNEYREQAELVTPGDLSG